MIGLCYYARRGVAIASCAALAWYSAKLAWDHTHQLYGPFAAVGAVILLVLSHHCFRDRQFGYGLVLGILGLTAAAISCGVVSMRVADDGRGQVQALKDANLPRKQAELTLAKADAEVTKAAAFTRSECAKPRMVTACKSARGLEAAARARATEARISVSKAGAPVTEAHAMPVVAAVLPYAFPIWTELAAAALGAFGFAPAPRANVTVPSVPMAPAAPMPSAPGGTLPLAPAPRAKRRTGKRANGTAKKRGTNSRAYILERLERIGRHDLARAVRAKEISAKAAADEGFRKLRLVAST
jgi:hypothetical protein